MFRSFLRKVLQAGVLLSGGVMVGVVIIQIIARFALPTAPYWTEEVARFAFIFMTSFAAGLAVEMGAYVKVDSLLEKLPQKAREGFTILTHAVISALMVILLVNSIAFIKVGAIQMSPSLELPMSYVHASIFILSMFVLLFSVFELLESVERIRKKHDP